VKSITGELVNVRIDHPTDYGHELNGRDLVEMRCRKMTDKLKEYIQRMSEDGHLRTFIAK
jgi:hypothetical protein